jgi:hypothetical protein
VPYDEALFASWAAAAASHVPVSADRSEEPTR